MLLKGGDVPGSGAQSFASHRQVGDREGALMRVELDCGFALAALLTKQACEELALQPGVGVVALVKAPHIHLIPR